MTNQREIGLVIRRELLKNLRGVKGIILLLLSLIGGTATSYAFVRSFSNRMKGVDPAMLRQAQEEAFTEMFRDADMGKYLADAPFTLLFMFNLCVWLAPALIWLASYDTVSGDVQYRAIRYFTVRTRKTSLYVGKFLGTWATVSIMTFAMHALMWIVAIVEGHTSTGNVLSWGVRLWLATIPIVGAWCGVAIFAGSHFRTPMTSLMVVGFTFFAIFIVGAIVPTIIVLSSKNIDDGTARFLAALYPNSYDRLLLSPDIEKVALGLLGTLGFAAVPTALGAWLFDKKDV